MIPHNLTRKPGGHAVRWGVALAALVLAAAAAGVAYRHTRRAVPRASGPIASEVYVWQRAWTGAVGEAVTERGRHFGSVVVLAHQVQWRGSEPRHTRIALDWAALRNAGPRPAAAIRIGTFGGDFTATAPVIAATVSELLAEARRQDVALTELQLDFDAATSKLEGYRRWLAAAQKAAAGTPVTVTALPSWLGSAEFPPLARQSAQGGGLVLQVHGLERPRDLADPVVLCDTGEARAAIERLGRLNVPFRVALPTYGYLLAYDEAGKFLALAAEDAVPGWGAGRTLREVLANADELAALVRDLQADRPASLQGVIWYRMPVAGDHLNFPWPTLRAVMAGRPPHAAMLTARLRKGEDGALELDLENTGERELRSPLTIHVAWPATATLIAADALGAAALDRNGDSLQFFAEALRLAPGSRQTLGWVRFDRAPHEQEIHIHVEQDTVSNDRRRPVAAAAPGDAGL